jgi:hypothetical protein
LLCDNKSRGRELMKEFQIDKFLPLADYRKISLCWGSELHCQLVVDPGKNLNIGRKNLNWSRRMHLSVPPVQPITIGGGSYFS